MINLFLHKNRIERLQSKRWKALHSTLLKSPFYRNLALNNTPLSKYPIVRKASFMANFESINTKTITLNEASTVAKKAEEDRDFSPMVKGISVGLSSGTSGNKGIFLASQEERAQWVACILDRVIGMSLSNRTVAFFLRANSNLYNSVQSRKLDFNFFDLQIQIDDHITPLNELQPTILVAQPSVLLDIAKLTKEGKIKISPSKIISVAEVLYPEDAIYLETIFDQKIHQVYQCTEGFLATTCEHGTLHFNEDFLIIEKKYLDADEKRFHPIITDLFRKSQPIIRYELDDIIHEKKECKCGSKFLAIDHIEGRSDDVLTFKSIDGKNVRVYPDFLRRKIVLSDDRILDYSLLYTKKETLELYTGNTESYNKAASAIRNYLKSINVHKIEIKESKVRNHIKGTKLRRIQNDHKAN